MLNVSRHLHLAYLLKEALIGFAGWVLLSDLFDIPSLGRITKNCPDQTAFVAVSKFGYIISTRAFISLPYSRQKLSKCYI